MDPAIGTSLISVLRRSDGLTACRIRRRESFQNPVVRRAPSEEDLAAVDPYIEQTVSLGDLPEARREPLSSVLKSWKELGDVRRLDGAALSHLLNVLIHTLPEESGKIPSPLAFEAEPPAWRPTAANPRAYKGTKDRPPKLKKRRPLDLRPYLSSPRDVNELILKLAPFQEAAARLLNQQGILFGDLPPLVDARGRVRDIYLDWSHQAGQESLPSLPPLFRRWLLYRQRGAPWKRIVRLLNLYRALDLENRAPLRRCVSRMLDHPMTAHAADWCDLILEQPRDRQTAFAELLIELGIGVRSPPPGIREILSRADELTPDRHYRHRMTVLLMSVRNGGNPEYLLSGMELAQNHRDGYFFDPVGRAAPVPMESIRSLVEHTSVKSLGLSLWSACAKLKGLDRLIEDARWRELPPDTVKGMFYLFAYSEYDTHLDPDLQAEKWAALRERADDLRECLRALPDRYHKKAVRHLTRIVGFWDAPKELSWSLNEYVKLLPRICHPPFQEDGCEDAPLSALTNLDESGWKQIRDGPDELFRKLERACRRENDAKLIAGGLHFFVLEGSELAVEGMTREPALILKAAKAMGGLGQSLQREVLQQWEAHPLMHEQLSGLPVERLVSLLVRHLPKELPASIPRKLKEHVLGRKQLSAEQLERGRKLVRSRLPAIRLRLLEHLCLERVSSRLRAGGREGKVLHAIRFYGNIDENRRALRKFLQAYFQGNRNYLRHHPLNREWLMRQKRMDRQAWLEGMRTPAVLRDGSEVTLHTEEDPLEALRLGTYVGSCTGLGGSFAYSAAAVVLDLNEHVVYARNSRGAVLGRQLLAISEQEQLVAFRVYPVGVSDELKRLFRDFDVEFARRLGLEIYKPGEDNADDHWGKVPQLLSKDWWDDCAWDPTADDEVSGPP